MKRGGFALFLVKLSILTIVILAIEYWLSQFVELPMDMIYYSSVVFFVTISILIYLIHSIGFRLHNSGSITFFTGATILKLVLSGAFLFIVLGFYSVHVITYVGVFFSNYVIYTFLELYVLINEQKNQNRLSNH